MNQEKEAQLKDSLEMLYHLPDSATAKWGKMNLQQMIEHVADFFQVSTGKIEYALVTPEEHLPKFKEFLLSDKAFRENTKAPASIIGEEPLPVRNASLQDAVKHLKASASDFFLFFNNAEVKKTTHPVFGPLNYEEWVLLHNKHLSHHLRQFQ